MAERVKYWNRLPWAWGTSISNDFQRELGPCLPAMMQVLLVLPWAGGWTSWPVEFPSSPVCYDFMLQRSSCAWSFTEYRISAIWACRTERTAKL